MNTFLKVSEITENISTLSDKKIKAQVQMTNTSDLHINNLKLLIKAKEGAILEQCIIRKRGSLCFDPSEAELVVGNLEPNETAYFEYAFTPGEDAETLSGQMIISYTPEFSEQEFSEKVTELLIEDKNRQA